MFFNSLRWRVQLWLAFLLVTVLAGFGVSVYQLQRLTQLGQIDQELERRVAVLSSALRGPPPYGRGFGPGMGPGPGVPRGPGPGPPPGERWPGPRGFGGDHGGPPGPRPDRPPPRDEPPMLRQFRLPEEASVLFDESRAHGYYFAVWSRSGTMLGRSSNAPVSLILPDSLRDTLTHQRQREAYREAYHFTEMGDCVLAGSDITEALQARRRFGWLLCAAGATVLAFGLSGSWWLSARAIRPVEEISSAARRIAAGKLSERIQVADADTELGQLAGVLNSTFSRLEASFLQQTRFTADASHELRTPLAVLITEAQTALARERSAAEYRDAVAACLDTAQQMRRLTESLLELSRLDAGREQTPAVRFDLVDIARVCVERLRPLAEQSGLRLECDLASANAFAHPERVDQVITNLLTNAIHYNKPEGSIVVTTRAEPDAAVLTVTDTGAGIAQEHLPHLFDRFYRADASRSGAAGRFGLGLAICHAVVEAAGGSIKVESRLGEGSTFTVRLPAQ
jgi:heavy metal sensor kinase